MYDVYDDVACSFVCRRTDYCGWGFVCKNMNCSPDDHYKTH